MIFLQFFGYFGTPRHDSLRVSVSNAIRNCPLCVMKNCPHHGFMVSVEG